MHRKVKIFRILTRGINNGSNVIYANHWHQITKLATNQSFLVRCPTNSAMQWQVIDWWPLKLCFCVHSVAYTHPFDGPVSRTIWVSQYQKGKGKTNLDFTEARDSEWQWHQLGHIRVCTSLQTDNHASTQPLSFLQSGCPSCRPTNSVKALKAHVHSCKQKKNHQHRHTWTLDQVTSPAYWQLNISINSSHCI